MQKLLLKLNEKQAEARGEIEKAIDVCQVLMETCIKTVFKPIEELARDVLPCHHQVSLDSHGNWELKFYFNSAREAQEKLGTVKEKFSFSDNELIDNSQNAELMLSTDNLSSIGVPKNLLTLLFFRDAISEMCTYLQRLPSFRLPDTELKKELKASIIIVKNIIAKVIEDDSIPDKILEFALKENRIDLNTEFFTHKDDPNDKTDLIKLMNDFRPKLLNDMQLEASVSNLSNALSKLPDEKKAKLSASREFLDFRVALAIYASEKNLSEKLETNKKFAEVFREVIAADSNIRSEIQHLRKDPSKEGQELANVLEHIITLLEKIPKLK